MRFALGGAHPDCVSRAPVTAAAVPLRISVLCRAGERAPRRLHCAAESGGWELCRAQRCPCASFLTATVLPSSSPGMGGLVQRRHWRFPFLFARGCLPLCAPSLIDRGSLRLPSPFLAAELALGDVPLLALRGRCAAWPAGSLCV